MHALGTRFSLAMPSLPAFQLAGAVGWRNGTGRCMLFWCPVLEWAVSRGMGGVAGG